MLPSLPAEMPQSQMPKRKRSDVEAEEQRDQSFTLTNLISNTPSSFAPISRLLRAHLPLSWLASPTSHDHLVPGSLLQGSIKSVGNWEYSVLVARRIPNGGLVALEKIEENCFVVQPLQPFVSEKWIQDAAIGAGPVVNLQMMLHYVPATDAIPCNDQKLSSGLDAGSSVNISKNRKGVVARLSILSPSELQSDTPSPKAERSRGSLSANIGYTSTEKCDPTTIVKNESISVSPKPMHSEVVCPTVKDHPEALTETQSDMLSPTYLRQRYLDHLYMTKTSLAYYAKGPLSRARARARAQDQSMTLSDLADFYRDSILPVKRMDTKYKETLPRISSEFALHGPDGAQLEKSKRKTKLGKDGLWPMESQFLFRWLETRGLKSPTVLERDSQAMRDAIASLRMREAQMQIILMLESLSIEAKQRESLSESMNLQKGPDAKAKSVEQNGLVEKHGLDAKRRRNLEADLEVLADRLCIWHSVGIEGSITSIEAISRNEDENSPKNRLRSFCADVLIPFYSSRLPILCKSLCKTLAGPEVFEQAQKSLRLKDASKATAPGTAVQRRRPSLNTKDITRVLSMDGLRPSSPPSLACPSALPPLPRLKQETSEPLQRPPSRSSRQASINFVNREIDLVADAQATASKKRKLERVASHKQDLAAAIDALRKPNRQTISNVYMDEIERRKLDAKNMVQITATPKVDRRKTLEITGSASVAQPKFDKDHKIPSSSRPTGGDFTDLVPRSSTKKKAVLAAIQQTPSKSTNRSSEALQPCDELAADPGSGIWAPAIEARILSTPSKSRLGKSTKLLTGNLVVDDGGKRGDFEVPDVALKTMDRAMIMTVPSTIYDELGWNDDFDE